MTENCTHRLHSWSAQMETLHSVVASGLSLRIHGGFDALHVKCEVHKVCGGHKSVFNQIVLVLSNLKHIALALNSGDSMRSFRATLRTVLESCLFYRPNSTPSSSDLKHNAACLDLFRPPTNATARLPRALIL